MLEGIQPKVISKMNDLLLCPYTIEDVESALKSFHPTKALGPDGFSAVFYKKYWHIVGRSILECALAITNPKASIKD